MFDLQYFFLCHCAAERDLRDRMGHDSPVAEFHTVRLEFVSKLFAEHSQFRYFFGFGRTGASGGPRSPRSKPMLMLDMRLGVTN